ncbi:hypothetical protein M569_11544, partial [Genlisea aurea]
LKMNECPSLRETLLRSRCHKGRLLYYFRPQQRNVTEGKETVSSWCGWHTDHGCITGLTRGMFMKDGVESGCSGSSAGFYVRARSGEIVKVVFGEEEIAFQVGEITEVLSRGRLCATPHCVNAPDGEAVERSVFALFMQPDW